MATYRGEFYRQYLLTHAWKVRRQCVLERAGYRCECVHEGQRCRSKGRLEIHHLTYQRLGQERMADLIALCESCHVFQHGFARPSNQLELPFAA